VPVRDIKRTADHELRFGTGIEVPDSEESGRKQSDSHGQLFYKFAKALVESTTKAGE